MNRDEVAEATRQWLEKAVIGLDLCPFAKPAYVNNQVRIVVSDARHADAFLEELDRELDFLAAADPGEVDTTLLVHPTLFADFLDFNEIAGIAEDAVVEHELDGVLQVASFHPRFQFEGTAADDIENYTNRSPFPTLHLLREDSIARAIATHPDAAAIFEKNIETMKKLGHDGWKALGIPAGKDDTQ